MFSRVRHCGVAASMNSNGGDQDTLVVDSSSNNYKSREIMMKDAHGMNYRVWTNRNRVLT